ncbi:hypothetical protein AK812_SmicGene32893 [Symbiodinium microadriaticum]|uniref:Uncharacterized protein n=1 Tax=Symbiodinium microadriaticum TaxID=2951 RepID=A0A1Q9CT12_SYMMI|nr:hypothetical protein AK812_SmicGene32893 [Symbiodinium microadriaticum]
MHALRRLAGSLRRGKRTEVKKVYVASTSDELLEEERADEVHAVHQPPLPATEPSEVPQATYVDNAVAACTAFVGDVSVWSFRHQKPESAGLVTGKCGWCGVVFLGDCQVEEVEDDMLGSPASMKASPSLPALPGRARASFGEDLRNGYESRARDREAWLSSLSSQQALPEDAPVQRMTAKELLALANVPDASPGRSLREPSDVFNEQLKRWNVQMKAKDGGEDRWNGNLACASWPSPRRLCKAHRMPRWNSRSPQVRHERSKPRAPLRLTARAPSPRRSSPRGGAARLLARSDRRSRDRPSPRSPRRGSPFQKPSASPPAENGKRLRDGAERPARKIKVTLNVTERLFPVTAQSAHDLAPQMRSEAKRSDLLVERKVVHTCVVAPVSTAGDVPGNTVDFMKVKLGRLWRTEAIERPAVKAKVVAAKRCLDWNGRRPSLFALCACPLSICPARTMAFDVVNPQLPRPALVDQGGRADTYLSTGLELFLNLPSEQFGCI